VLRRTFVATIVLSLASGAAPVRAVLWNGTCALDLTFTFGSRVKPANAVTLTATAPTYSIAVTPAADLNPQTGADEPCAVTLSALNPFRETSVTSASGASTVWTCEATDGEGSWTQAWDPSPPVATGSHTITGGGGAWTMTFTNALASFVGVMELTVHPDDSAKLNTCRTTGILSLKMTGLMAFSR
jgi:hypothetical protein